MTSLTRKQRREQERRQKKTAKKLGKLSNQITNRFEQNSVMDTSKKLGLSSLSDIITDLAEPLYDADWSQDGIFDIYDLVCSCWNIGTCDEEHQSFLWNLLLENPLYENFYDPDKILENKLREIIDKRRSEFSEDRRFVIDLHLEFTNNIMNLKIASAPISQEEFLIMQAAKAYEEEAI